MKKDIKKNVIASVMVLGLLAAPVFAHNSGTTQQPGQQMQGGMMGGGMQQGGGTMNRGMMGSGMMGGKQGNWSGMGCNGMMGGAMMNQMTPGQQQTYMDQTSDLRKQMMDLRFDYRDAMRNPKTTPQELAKIEKQMLELRSQMIGKIENLQGQ
ncbi:MAG: hypothetical protein JRC87_05570 [Deltaproteobacteria bacterium]|nr:hypothetical protein [Deltaproteobacteria bacterium]MBW2659058.1 hypothetical protein [Deltaproteobacteria bacterium]